ncbi:hypothetical protein ASD76_03480 [Altererythrobacter sp. Root672]|nr:hypothetical protein ASD76_03480 [Altererythrobacter sp. Root672]
MVERIPAIRRAILADIPFGKALLWSAVAIAAPTGLRWVIDRGEAGIPFVTYYPFVVGAALLLGWRWGAAVALVSTVIANRLFRAEPLLDSLDASNWALGVLFVLSCTALVWLGDAARRLVREQEAAEARERHLNQELMHRVKNMMATVNALVMLTSRHSDPGNFTQALAGRMKALDRATGMLGVDADRQCDLGKLVEGAIEPFKGEGNFVASGPACSLPRQSCVPLSLALHELCTNAARHGALSAPGGKVELLWTLREVEGEGVLTLYWREQDGPPVARERRTGMGTQLLRVQAGIDECDLEFAPEGVKCRIAIEGVEL